MRRTHSHFAWLLVLFCSAWSSITFTEATTKAKTICGYLMEELGHSHQTYPYGVTEYCHQDYLSLVYPSLHNEANGNKKCIAVSSVIEQILNSVAEKVRDYVPDPPPAVLNSFDALSDFGSRCEVCDFFENIKQWTDVLKPKYEADAPPVQLTITNAPKDLYDAVYDATQTFKWGNPKRKKSAFTYLETAVTEDEYERTFPGPGFKPELRIKITEITHNTEYVMPDRFSMEAMMAANSVTSEHVCTSDVVVFTFEEVRSNGKETKWEDTGNFEEFKQMVTAFLTRTRKTNTEHIGCEAAFKWTVGQVNFEKLKMGKSIIGTKGIFHGNAQYILVFSKKNVQGLPLTVELRKKSTSTTEKGAVMAIVSVGEKIGYRQPAKAVIIGVHLDKKSGQQIANQEQILTDLLKSQVPSRFERMEMKALGEENWKSQKNWKPHLAALMRTSFMVTMLGGDSNYREGESVYGDALTEEAKEAEAVSKEVFVDSVVSVVAADPMSDGGFAALKTFVKSDLNLDPSKNALVGPPFGGTADFSYLMWPTYPLIEEQSKELCKGKKEGNIIPNPYGPIFEAWKAVHTARRARRTGGEDDVDPLTPAVINALKDEILKLPETLKNDEGLKLQKGHSNFGYLDRFFLLPGDGTEVTRLNTVQSWAFGGDHIPMLQTVEAVFKPTSPWLPSYAMKQAMNPTFKNA
eukprot:g2093.t1